MERVVYFLGAGFSAPLGLPVMSNFLEKSKDLYFLDTHRYRHFELVLETIARMSVVKNYYSTDLLNIEEILSIVAMQQGLRGRRLKNDFLRYIADVVNHYTPSLKPRTGAWRSNWQTQIFASTGETISRFGPFIGSLLQLRVAATERSISPLRASRLPVPLAEYSVVTLNYDLVLERFQQYLIENLENEDLLPFLKQPPTEIAAGARGVPLIKLHGSADTGVIVAPTWNKTLAQKLLPSWKAAFEQLVNANHIRIIGYSLPTADAYIKYLLRAAAIESPHLKKIDVLCKDDRRSTVQARYEDFIGFANFRFVNGSAEDYLNVIAEETFAGFKGFNINSQAPISFRSLETAHARFFAAKAA